MLCLSDLPPKTCGFSSLALVLKWHLNCLGHGEMQKAEGGAWEAETNLELPHATCRLGTRQFYGTSRKAHAYSLANEES